MEKALPCAPGPTVASRMGVRGGHCGRPGPKAHSQAGHKAGRLRSLHSPVAPNCPTGGRCLLPRVPGVGRERKEGKTGGGPPLWPSSHWGSLWKPQRGRGQGWIPQSRGLSASPVPVTVQVSLLKSVSMSPHTTAHPQTLLWAQAPLPWEGPHWLPALLSLEAAARPSPKAPGFPRCLEGRVCVGLTRRLGAVVGGAGAEWALRLRPPPPPTQDGPLVRARGCRTGRRALLLEGPDPERPRPRARFPAPRLLRRRAPMRGEGPG